MREDNSEWLDLEARVKVGLLDLGHVYRKELTKRWKCNGYKVGHIMRRAVRLGLATKEGKHVWKIIR